jgi:chorismate mutase
MNISDWRQRMDEIDKKLVELLNERSQCVEVGRSQASGRYADLPAGA